MKLGRLDHIGVGVKDLEATIALYESTLGGRVRSRHPNYHGEIDAAFVAVGDSVLEFLAPLKEEGVMGRFLKRHGEGLHHLAYQVEDIREAVKSLVEAGLQPLDKEPRPGILGDLIFFFHPKSTSGVLIELVEAPPER
jgi:methylmalonyl-CoA/ethylmalonyl-CoA epimerase